MTITELKPKALEETVKLLEDALAKAKAGELTQVSIIGYSKDKTLNMFPHTFNNRFDLMAGMMFSLLRTMDVVFMEDLEQGE